MTPFTSRFQISGRLTTATPLHIGSGKDGRLAGRDHDCALVETDGTHPYLTGSALKGVVRQWLEKRLPGEQTHLDSMFGRLGTSQAPELARGGKVVFEDAFVAPPDARDAGTPGARPALAPLHETAVKIEASTRTAEKRFLFASELVAAGASFQVQIWADNLSGAEKAILLLGMRAFGACDAPDADAARLGASRNSGKGALRWEATDERLAEVRPDSLAEWLEAGAASSWRKALKPLPEQGLAELERAVDALRAGLRPVGAIQVPIRVDFETFFLVHDATRPRPAGSATEVHQCRLGSDGKPILPARSVRGALRAQAARIVETVRSGDPELAGALELLFGTTKARGALELSDFRIDGEPRFKRLEMVAVDRFSGGAAAGKKYTVEAVVQPTFRGSLILHSQGIPAQHPAARLLAFVLRDWAEGDIALGFGASKGFGACTAVLDPAVGMAADDPSLAELLRSALEPGAMGNRAADPAGSAAASPGPPSAAPAGAPGKFHNPYHFVPLAVPPWRAGQAAAPQVLRLKDFDERKLAGFSHAAYQPDRLSGRILCRLWTEDPVVIGAEQTERPGDTKLVEPFEIEPGRPAVPATSLRGMLASLYEAATQSAPRILTNASLSYRKARKESLSAIGMIKAKRGANGKRTWALLPLALPTLKLRGQGYGVDPVWRQLFPKPRLKVYLDAGPALDGRPLETWKPGSPLCYLKLAHLEYAEGGHGDLPTSDHVHDKQGFAVAQRPSDGDWQLRAEAGLAVLPSRKGYMSGIVRVLTALGRSFPSERKHDLFLPYSEKYDREDRWVPIDPPAVRRFEELADERSESCKEGATPEELLPYHPTGTRPNRHGSARKMRLQEGDLVWFRAKLDADQQPVVDEIAYASIWRGQVGGSVHEFFTKPDMAPDFLPLQPGREQLSPAELLFGFVQEGAESRAYAGRLRVSAATLGDQAGEAYLRSDAADGRFKLKILSVPKPPSPALYFKPRSSEGYVGKSELSPRSHEPHGRKFYLHPTQSPLGSRRPWVATENDGASENLGQHSSVKPVAPERRFWFHIDFTNLSRAELGALLYVLRPSASYRHKLGMGKPVGLGRIRLDPQAVLYVDRKRRYAKDGSALAAPRYHEVTFVTGTDGTQWGGAYTRERMSLGSCRPGPRLEEEPGASTSGAPEDVSLREAARTLLCPVARHALEQMGDPSKLAAPVRYPEATAWNAKLRRLETNSYTWFVLNDAPGGPKHFLKPLNPDRTLADTILDTPPPPPRKP